MSETLVITRTPHRVGFLGGGTDIPEVSGQIGGAVLSAAINKYVYVTVKRHGGLFEERFRLQYSSTESCRAVSEIKNDIIRQSLYYFNIDEPLVVSTMSDLPASSGMGSSSSFAVGLVAALNKLFDLGISSLGIAEVAFEIERSTPGSLAGRQDMYAAVFGGLNLFEFGQVTKCSHVACSDLLLKEFFPSIRLVWTGTQRNSSDVLADQVDLAVRNIGIYKEMKDLAYKGFDLLNMTSEKNLIHSFGCLLQANASLKYQLSPSVFPSSINKVLNLIPNDSLVGTKLLGAGGGGFILCLFKSATAAQQVVASNANLVWLPVSLELGGVSILKEL